jgi:hypothetical protein
MNTDYTSTNSAYHQQIEGRTHRISGTIDTQAVIAATKELLSAVKDHVVLTDSCEQCSRIKKAIDDLEKLGVAASAKTTAPEPVVRPGFHLNCLDGKWYPD